MSLNFFLYDSEQKLRYDPKNFDLKGFDHFDEIIKSSGEVSQETEKHFLYNRLHGQIKLCLEVTDCGE